MLVDALSGEQRSAGALRAAIGRGERIVLSAIALHEWLCGARLEPELAVQEALFPAATAVAFRPEEAQRVAELYRRVPRPRGREIDLAVAASALTHDAAPWTLDRSDFADVLDLRLYDAQADR